MAAGDIFADLQTLAISGTIDVRPAAGLEAVVHNMYYGLTAVIYRIKGGIVTAIVPATGSEGITKGPFRVSDTDYLRIENVGAGPTGCGYDGVYTK